MQKAFTLAEVLLTLAIIGIVAALTIPAVVTKVTKEQYVTGLKKAWNTVKAVERAAIQEYGPMENWNRAGITNNEKFEVYYKEFFDLLKTCEDTEKGCWADKITYLNGKVNTYDYNNPDYYRFITSDGMAWAYRDDTFEIDVNGLKNPNRVGRDIFYFYPSGSSGTPRSYKPYGWQYSTTNINEYCNPSAEVTGYDCTAKVLAEGKMDY